VLKLYDEYVLNYKNAQDVLKLVKSRGKLNPYLAELAQKHPSMGELSNILAQPLTYIAKTHALLEQLIANCEPGSTDMVLLERAHSVFVERAASLQQSLAGSVSIVAILGVQRRLTGADGIELLKPDRTLVSEGTVLQNGSKRHLFFFNDLLLVTRPSSKGNQCRFKEAISITSLELLDDPSDIKAFVVKVVCVRTSVTHDLLTLTYCCLCDSRLIIRTTLSPSRRRSATRGCRKCSRSSPSSPSIKVAVIHSPTHSLVHSFSHSLRL